LAQVDEKCLEKRLPENIIIYRDGAGDIQTVLDVELKGIKVYLKKGKKISF
jgi:hypothetical protein